MMTLRHLLARPALAITLKIVVAALALRVLTAVVAFLLNVTLPMAQPEQFTIYPRTHLFWDTFARWDSGWFFGIARYGYDWVEGGRNNLAYFPVYPMLMRYIAIAMGGGRLRVFMAGIIISWTAFVLAMIVLHRLARIELPEGGAGRAVAFAALFPFAFFFGVVYSESLFLLFSVTAFFGFRTRRWWLGALAGALATATRANGIFIVPALALVAWRDTRGDRGAQLRAGVALAFTLVGVTAYSAFVYSLSGHPFEWAHAMARWHWQPGSAPPWQPLLDVASGVLFRPLEYLGGSHQAVVDLLNASAGTALLVAAPFIWRRFGAGYAVLILINLGVPLSSGALEGLGRYSAVLFPFALWLATFRSAFVRTAVIAAYGMFYVLCLALFTKVYPLY